MKIGIIGTGRISNRFIPESKFVTDIEVAAVYNPKLKSAKVFAENHNIDFYTDDLELFWQHIDSVYIASPHQTHYDYIKSALLHNINVLCEKPMVLSKNHATELFELADKQKCVLMEGIKTAYCPGFKKLLEVIQSGVIGEVRDVEACFTKLTDDTSLRELSDTKYGGSLTELGSYTLYGIFSILGIDYTDIRIESINADNGVDLYSKVYLKYDNAFATSKTGLGVKSEGQMIVSGSKGYIKVHAPWWKTTSFEVCFEDLSRNYTIESEYLGDGLRYELLEFLYLINNSNLGLIDISLSISDVIDKFLSER